MPAIVTVFFRFDDYAETSPSEVEAGLVAALRRHRMAMTFAVIPSITEGSYHLAGERGTMPMGPAKALFLRQAVDDGAVDAALHGWNHRTVAARAPHSEFSGLDLKVQVEKISQGQQALRQHLPESPSVFVPPWNSYDVTTLEALADQGVTGISANRYGPSNDGQLMFAPITVDVRELRQAVGAARASGDSDPIVGVLLHPYDFRESGDARGDFSCEALDADLQWLATQPDVRVVSVGQLLRENGTLRAERYRSNQPWGLEQVAPPFVRRTVDTPFFMTAAGARRANHRRAIATVATHLIAFLVGVAVDRLAALVLASMPAVLVSGHYLVGALLAALIARTAIVREIRFRPFLAMAFFVGVLISAWVGV